MPSRQQLFSFWSGPITWMERLSIESARAVGHDVTVYSFEPEQLARGGLDCTVADARLILDRQPARTRDGTLLLSHFSDHFRVEGMAKGCGTWIDLDVLFLLPLPTEPYLFGWSSQRTINNAVLRLPPGSPLLQEYVAMCRSSNGHDLPSWYPWHRRMHRRFKGEIRRLFGGKPALPIYGPRTLTHLVRKHGLAHLAKPQPVFYPVASDKRQIAEMLDWPARYIQPETVTMHLWRSSWKACHGAAVPPWAEAPLVAA